MNLILFFIFAFCLFSFWIYKVIQDDKCNCTESYHDGCPRSRKDSRYWKALEKEQTKTLSQNDTVLVLNTNSKSKTLLNEKREQRQIEFVPRLQLEYKQDKRTQLTLVSRGEN